MRGTQENVCVRHAEKDRHRETVTLKERERETVREREPDICLV